jgi:F0F1-type ATP synthase membrane subunit a
METILQLWMKSLDFVSLLGDWFSSLPLSLLRGELFLLLLIILFALFYYLFKSDKLFLYFWKRFILLFELLFEKIYWFFDEIIWENQKFWVKSFVIWIFFVILFSNLLWTTVDFLDTMFPWLDKYITAPTTDVNFNIAMALIAVGLILFVQFRKLGFFKFIYSYLPIFWKNIVSIERNNMSWWIYYPLLVFVKLFDIIISMFVWILDIIWNIAKVISLSFRLTGNMMSWTILLWMLVAWLNLLTNSITGIDFPILLPLIVVLQWLLVAVIQAFVFALLTAIFIKVATED